ncbi:MAG: spore maturation protein A [Oscillospiraceae bacterium]|nr:spore maturation protein A [Oscillospiraceae bacterium]
MMNYIWGAMILVSLIVSIFNGNCGETVNAGLTAAKNSVGTVMSFAGILCMWSGIMRIAEDGGISAALSKLLSPVMKRIFPKIPPDSEAMRCITMNVTANLLGMGNAATPLGLSAMSKLDEMNGSGEYASDEMCCFTVLNTAALTIIPSTIISLRAAAGSADPFEITAPVWISSIVSVTTALCAVKLFIFMGAKVRARAALRRKDHALDK